MNAVPLFYRIQGEGSIPIVILHGVFGSSDNWLSLSKRWAEHYQVITVDARNHGQSPHSGVFNYEIMVEDLKHLLDHLGLSKIYLIGHSMGGKTALFFAKQYPEYLEKMIVVDIAPKSYPVHHTHIVEAMQSIDIHQLEKIGDADEHLKQRLPLKSLRDFLLKNIGRSESGYHWKINLPIIAQNLEAIGEACNDFQCSVPTLFIKGGTSNYITEEDIIQIQNQFDTVTSVTIPNAGHWVQAEQPILFSETVFNFLKG